MISFQINETVYATNDSLTGFFTRPEHEGAYRQLYGNSDLGFATEKDFNKYAKAYHNRGFEEEQKRRRPDVTYNGKFVWRRV